MMYNIVCFTVSKGMTMTFFDTTNSQVIHNVYNSSRRFSSILRGCCLEKISITSSTFKSMS